MKRKKPGKLLWLLLSIMIVVGAFSTTTVFAATCPISGATGAGTETDPVIVDTYKEFKAALEYKGDLSIRVDKDIKQNISTGKGYAAGDVAITIPAKTSKHLTLNATVDIKAVDKDGVMYSLIDVMGELVIDGSGTLIGGFNANNSQNAILFIESPGAVTINGNPTLKVYSNISTYGKAIMNYTGKLTINGGSFEAENASSRNIPTYAVDVRSSFGTTINGGYFNVVGSKVTDADCGLRVQSKGNIVLNGGTYSGILSEAGNLSDLLGSGQKYYKGNEEFNASGLNKTAETLKVEIQTVKSVSATVTKPKAGKTPADMSVTVPTDVPYTAEILHWIDDPNGVFSVMSTGDAFEAGHTYMIEVTFTPKEGYRLNGWETTGEINGENAEASGLNPVTGEISFRINYEVAAEIQTINSVSATVTKPEAGKTPADMSISVPTDANYTAKLIFWIDNASGEAVDTFEAGHSYYARVEVTPKPGYELAAKPDVKVNGMKATSSTFGCFDSSVFDVNPEEIEITQANVTLENFKVGNKISDVILTCEHPEQYVASNLRVRTGIGETPLADNDILEDRTYLVEVKITPKDGYIISSSTNSHITNGDGFEGGTDPSMPWKYVTPEKDTPSHTHTATLVSGQAATCTADGWKDYYKCDCGKFFEDAACTSEIVNLEAWKTGAGKLAKLPHNLGEWKHDDTGHWKKCSVCGAIVDKAEHTYGEWTVVTAATETTDGLEKRVCSVCGHEETRVIPAEGHTHSTTKVAGQAPTCTTDGWKDYYKCDCGKFFEDEACTSEIVNLEAWKTGAGKLAKLPHNLGEWKHDDTGHWKKCSVCGAIVDKAEHTYGEWTVVTAATETTNGLEKRVCSVCGHEETRVIPATGIEDPEVPTDPETPDVPADPEKPEVPSDSEKPAKPADSKKNNSKKPKLPETFDASLLPLGGAVTTLSMGGITAGCALYLNNKNKKH